MFCAVCGEKVIDEAAGCPACGTSTRESSSPEVGDPPRSDRLPSPARSQTSTDATPKAAAGRFAPGTVLGDRYRLVCLLGRGGMGEVYRAEDLRLGQDVALKFLPPALEQDAAVRERFLDEVRLARKVSHANVCRVYDLGDAEGLPFLSMEYVDGENVQALLKRVGRLPGERAAEVSLGICRGLAATHGRGILHGDLKPSNVMIDADGRVRLTDFGLATLADSPAAHHGGTPAYMAPEQHQDREATRRSELYALGLVMYELFTGRRAFGPESPAPPSRWVGTLDPTVERVILWCLEKDPGNRPASAEAVAAALLADRGIEAGTFLRAVVASDLSGPAAEGREGSIRDLQAEYGGREIATAGGTLWLFERPWGALSFALAYHRALARQPAAAVRIGLDFGEVTLSRGAATESSSDTGRLLAAGPTVTMARRLLVPARPQQTLLTAEAFHLARQSAVREAVTDVDLRWVAHGNYLLPGLEQGIEIFEVGVEGTAPLTPPPSSELAARIPGQDVIAGWRPAPGLSVPQRANWKLERRLGEGGFGETWLARHAKSRDARVFKFCHEQSRLKALQREITIFRLLKEELGDRADVARILDWNFEQAPYFIEADYTAGGNLTEWAEDRGGLDRVPLEVRLEIVAQVATALAAAHSVGVLHKDVKPQNVLITGERAGSVRAQLSDFGLGSVTERERLEKAGITVAGLSIAEMSGTHLYMAPELLEGRRATLQADVYALGVMLYQMVVGDFSRALAPGWDRDVDDAILREDVAAAVDGSPLKRLGTALELAERLRSLDRRRREREAERQEREEAERVRQRAERVRRQRRLMAAAIVVLMVFGAAMTFMAYRVDREAKRATREAEAARKVSDFLVELFEVSDPYGTSDPGKPKGETITAREILALGADKLETELADQPEIRARLMHTVGRVYKNLGLYDAAVPLVEESLKIRREIFGEVHPEVSESLNNLATLLYSKGDYEDAEPLFREALEMRRRLLGDEHPDVAASLNNLAALLCSKGDYEGAEPLFRETLTIKRRLLGDEDPDVAITLNNLAFLLNSRGDYEAAEPLFREALEIRRRHLGSEHPDVAQGINNLAGLLHSKGDYEAAEPLFREALEMRQRILGDEHPDVAESLHNVALSLHAQNDYEGAEPLYRRALEMQRRLLGAGDPALANGLSALARLVLARDEAVEAEGLIREALDVLRRTLPPDDWRISNAESILGASLTAQRRYAEAETLLVRSYPIVRDRTSEESIYTRDVLERLVILYQAWGKPDKAAEYRPLWVAAGGSR
ncbi:MAG: tetratricopeptide repeat protein [bacterium]|nr:tetratricopeptide repeat protein [bacterium]